MSARLVTTIDDLCGNIGMPAYRVTNHEGRHLDSVLVHQIQDPWHTFACTVFIERVLSQIRESVQNRFGDGSSGAADRLTPRLELHGHGDRQACAFRPEGFGVRHGRRLSGDG